DGDGRSLKRRRGGPYAGRPAPFFCPWGVAHPSPRWRLCRPPEPGRGGRMKGVFGNREGAVVSLASAGFPELGPSRLPTTLPPCPFVTPAHSRRRHSRTGATS